MLAKKFRFTAGLFDRVFRRSKKIRIDGHTFLVSDTRQQPKFAVVAGKKISKSAVKRNRLRRQLYELMRTELLGKVVDKNVIFLYNGPEVFSAHDDFRATCKKLIQHLSS